MKKKSLIALLLAASLSFGVATATGCNIIGTDNPGTNGGQTEDGDVSVTGVSISDSEITLGINGSQKLTATVTPTNAKNKGVIWSSDKENIAEVDQNGNVTAKAEGTAKITVTTSDGGFTATCTVTVDSDPDDLLVKVTGVTVSPKTVTLKAGNTTTLNATVTPAGATNAKVSWSSSDENTATVDQNGKVTAIKKGTATITVTTADGGKTDTCVVTVEGTTQNTLVTGISLGSTSATLDLNGQKTKQFALTVTPSGATNKTVTWSSSNSTAVEVDQNGLATAKATGTAVITATANDGSGVKGSCTVTVINSYVKPTVKYTVDFYSEGVKVTSQEVEEGKLASIPTDIKKEGYYISGWGTASATGANYDFSKPVTGNLTLHAKWEKVAEGLSYSYAGNECAAFEWGDGNPLGATVRYKITGGNSYLTADSELVRSASTAGSARVDVVGLKGGENYDFEITSSSGKKMTVSNMQISAYDRSGYAHFNYTSGVGGYNDDGTPKSNARIVYVTEETKNTVKLGTKTGIVNILKNAGTSTPLIVRVIGTVGAATWNNLEHSTPNSSGGYNPITPDKVVGKNGTALAKQKWDQQDLIDGGYNTLNTSVYSELVGLSSQIKWDSGKKEFDSCWNDCSISSVKNVTVEGIGEDARIFQWGMTFKSSNSIEVRNLTFEDYTEDACSFEGSTGATSVSSFNSKNIWIHHNVFEEGMNYWDVCNEQDKHDGDGSTDFKGVAGVTISYNVYNKTHKTGLIGGSNSHKTANVTFHHNAYNQCKSRLPLARQANMHMYNNYYNGTTSTDISLRASAYAFVENCYFSSTKSTNIELQKNDADNNGHGAAKVVGCIFAGKKVVTTGVPEDYLYVGNNRLATVTNTNIFSQNFDTNSSVFYYDSATQTTKVTHMLTAEQVPTEIPKLAGVQKHTGSTGSGGSGEGGGETGGDEHEHTYSDTYTPAGASGHYKMANCEHTTEHTDLEPHVYDNETDATCNVCGYVRTIGGGSEGGEVVPTFTTNSKDLPSDFQTSAKDTAIEVTDKIAFGSNGILSLVPSTENGVDNKWKLYTNSNKETIPWVQNNGIGATIEIDLTKYTGNVELSIVARTTGSSNKGRYYCISGNEVNLYCAGYNTETGIANSNQTDTFVLQAGHKYVLTCSAGLRFLSFAFTATQNSPTATMPAP